MRVRVVIVVSAAVLAGTAVGTAHQVTAHLDQPLGTRRLVDAACVRDCGHGQCDVREREEESGADRPTEAGGFRIWRGT